MGEAAKHRESCLSPFSSVALSGLTEPVGATGGAGLAPPTQPAVDMLQRNPPRVGVVGGLYRVWVWGAGRGMGKI